MKIIAPKHPRFERFLKASQYKKVKETSTTITFEGIFSLHVTRDFLHMKKREFTKFCRELKVSGGRVVRKGDSLYITAYLRRKVSFKLSEDEYKLLRAMAKQAGVKVSEYIRNIIVNILAKTPEALSMEAT